MTPRAIRLTLFVVLAVAFALRVRYLMAGVPFAVEIDEPAIVDRALAIITSGNWHPRGFDYPSLVVYMQAVVNIAQFLRGAVEGSWPSLDRYGIDAAYQAGRFVSALIGTSTVWLTYRLGKSLHSRSLGLIAAAQLAVYPMHVRESHFVLTDSPATALVALTLLLTIRATRRGTVGAYAAAGAAVGLAAAAKYNAGVVAVVLPVAWGLHERTAPDRMLKALAMAVAVLVAFLLAVPYALIDVPGFLTGLGGQMERFSAGGLATGDDSPWRVYLVHLSLASRVWLPIAGIGALLVAWRRVALTRWAIPVAFVLAYYYVLSTHRVVFGRYALPLLPALCLLAALPILELARIVAARWRNARLTAAVVAITVAALLVPLLMGSVEWLGEFRRVDTRELAGRWMIAALPRGTKMVVENSGPTNLDHLGFDVVDRPNQLDDPPDEYRARGVEYVLIATFSEGDLHRYETIVTAGRVVLSVDPGGARWGPYIRAVKLEGTP